MTKVLMTMGLPSDRSHEQSANIEFANSIRCYSDPCFDVATEQPDEALYRGWVLTGQRTTALPPGFAGKPWAADLHLAPDGRHLYASERTSSTITVYEVDASSGQLKALAQVPTEKTPRGFAIDPAGRYLVAAGQESHAIAVYAIDAASGALSALQRYPVGKNPNWVEIVDLP